MRSRPSISTVPFVSTTVKAEPPSPSASRIHLMYASFASDRIRSSAPCSRASATAARTPPSAGARPSARSISASECPAACSWPAHQSMSCVHWSPPASRRCASAQMRPSGSSSSKTNVSEFSLMSDQSKSKTIRSGAVDVMSTQDQSSRTCDSGKFYCYGPQVRTYGPIGPI
eukprot:3698564-Prymnesium_polylepis.2